MSSPHREDIGKILTDALPILQDYLNPTNIIHTLVSKQMLTDNEASDIEGAASVEGASAMGVRVEKLLDSLKRKKGTVYKEFMEILRKERDDLYADVKKVEKQHLGSMYVKPGVQVNQ